MKFIIITFNEELHVRRCIESILNVTDDIFVLDSFSTDSTIQILDELKVSYSQRAFTSYYDQLNWILHHFISYDGWFMRLDADEYLTPDIIHFLNSYDFENTVYSAFEVKRKMQFLSNKLPSSISTNHVIRLFKSSSGFFSHDEMDEHFITSGLVKRLNYCIIDDNLNSLDFFINKHISYAKKESIKIYRLSDVSIYHGTSRYKFLLKYIYYKLPFGFRPILYFLFRYCLRFGFIGGRRAFLYLVIQSFFYRILVDFYRSFKKQ